MLADELDPHPGIALEHVGDQPRSAVQPSDPEHAEPDGPGLQRPHTGDRPFGLVDRGQDLLRVGSQGVGHRGGHDASPDPAEELDAELSLQIPDLLGDRRLGVAELLGGGGQRTVLVGGEEAAELVQRKHRNLLEVCQERKATSM